MPYQPRVAILVPGPDYSEKWTLAFARKARALTNAGLAVEHREWKNTGDLSGFDLILPLIAWGYQRDVAAWDALLDRLENEHLPIRNSAAVLRWNSDKAYLNDLGAKGVSIVPTVDVAELDDAELADARAELGVDEVVVKPAISGGADGTHRISAGAGVPADARRRRRLVQPLMAGIFDEGEFSLFYFDGQFSHAIVKRPAVGDFRVQEQFGGQERAWEASKAARRLALAALAAAPAPTLYARVDMVGDAVGKLHIMELELIEPSLFLHFAHDKGAAFGQAVAANIAHY